MNDHSITKVVCRVFTLICYIAVAGGAYLEPELVDDSIMDVVSENIRMIVIVLAAIIVLLMIVSLIVKYKMEDQSKVNVYRIVDVMVRLLFTSPVALLLNLYVGQWLSADAIVSFAAGVVIFFVINAILKFTLQETMSVTFMKSDAL